MQSCSVHHCVLFLLTLTLTTDSGSASCVFPIYAKLHQSVTLPCGAPCSGRAKWSLDSNRDVVFARCDQTSCTSLKDGYEMSYDRFKKGDLSLTITKPDYSMRETYTCECDYSDYATVNLRISTVFSAVQMSPYEDLKLDVSVPESVEVIYRSNVSADGVQICTVTYRTLQCKSEYTPRTSLSYPELTLRHMERSESGTYTIRNLDYKEDIRVYAVSVSDPGSAAKFPIYAKLHQSVTLPCEVQCSGRAKWALDSNRDDIFARCDQTSCRSLKDGYEMSYDQFKKGDLSLTITNADYSMRETYTCECDYSDYATARLRISPVFSAVQMSPYEDLKLDLSVPESVEVIYRSNVSADGVQICTVTYRTLQCKSEYTPRTSLSYPELTLRHMERSESGTYTIRNLDYQEDIRVYAVSVSGMSPFGVEAVPPWAIMVMAVLAAFVMMFFSMWLWLINKVYCNCYNHSSYGP